MKLLYSRTVTAPLRNLARLATCLGATAKTIDLVHGDSLARVSGDAPRDASALVVDVGSLAHDRDAVGRLQDLLARAGDRCAILLFVTTSNPATTALLSELTRGAISAVEVVNGTDAAYLTAARSPAPELAGHAYARAPTETLGLVAAASAVEVVQTVGGHATFARLRDRATRDIFVWSTSGVFDVTRPLDDEGEMEHAVAEWIPGLAFVRAAIGDQAWHGRGAAAAIVVDDPLLTRRYGCIDFGPLLASARRHRYRVTLAFIPWNHWRTRVADTALFRAHADAFSLCVHGDDHTDGEFEVGAYAELEARAREAVARMDAHRERTGLPYEPVMVCPQERYSVEGLRAIAATGRYVAVANTRLIPESPAARGRVTAADLLEPATDVWFGLPLLKRHYAHEGIAKFALGLFIGRPAVLAEHHQFFVSGAGAAESFVESLRDLRSDVTWRPLAETVRRLDWRRRIGDARCRVRFYADDFLFEPGAGAFGTVEFERRVPEAAVVTAVHVEGRAVDFSHADDRLRFETTVRESLPVRVRVERSTPAGAAARVVTAGYRVRVAARRGLSELRDRLVAQGPAGTGIARALRRTLRQASG